MTEIVNLIWYNQAYVYFNLCESAGKFCKEFNYIRKKLGLLKPYVPKNTDGTTT